jgi:putative two-component system response regulator
MLINRGMRVAVLAEDITVLSPEFAQLFSIGMLYIPTDSPEELIGLCAGGTIDGVILGPIAPYTVGLIQTIKSDPHTNVPILVMLSAEQLEYEERILIQGADHVVCAPWNASGIRARVERMCRKHLQGLGIESHSAIMRSLSLTVEKHDPYTGQHLERLRFLTGHVALQMGRSSREVAAIRAAGLLHDIGKISIPGSILRKPSALSPKEWDIMRLHPITGAEIALQLPQGDEVAPMVRAHHERWDGKGYPDGLGETDIPLGGRIVSVVDAFDAMTTNRPYRAGMPFGEATDRLIKGSGSQFDPSVVESLLSLSPGMLKKHFETTSR